MKTSKTQTITAELEIGIEVSVECNGDGVPQTVDATAYNDEEEMWSLHASAEQVEALGKYIANLRDEAPSYRRPHGVCPDHGYWDRRYYRCIKCDPPTEKELATHAEAEQAAKGAA